MKDYIYVITNPDTYKYVVTEWEKFMGTKMPRDKDKKKKKKPKPDKK